MNVLFSASSFGFLRNFQSTIRLLAEQGHRLHLVAERTDVIDGQKMVDALVAEHPAITFEILPSSRHRLWYALGTGIRASLDYWRYLDSRWHDAPKLRERARSLAPPLARWVAETPLVGSRPSLRVLHRLFRAVDRMLPAPPEVRAVFLRQKPDVLLLTPLLYFRSHQVDHVRCARELGIPSVLGVGSWDHLTTKGLIHEIPDRVLVWNEAQKQEAIELHGVPAERVTVTGAQAYDHWFATKPSLDRPAFAAQVGLDPQRPYLLYLCSSPFIAPFEVDFVRRWIAAIRASADPVLKTAGILVRPHPQNAKQWQDVDLAAEFASGDATSGTHEAASASSNATDANIAVWPKQGVNPIGGVARADYFDSMYHAEAVIGVNTSGMIESGIIGRPVYSIASSEFADTQEGTLHFQHLKNVQGGLLHLAASLDEHVEQLSRLFADGSAERHGARSFIQGFIRPHGLDVAATPRVVGAILETAAQKLTPQPTAVHAHVARPVLAPVAVIATLTTMERAKLRAVMLHWTRPTRLALRGLVSRSIYAGRFVRRLPRRGARLAMSAVRVIAIDPLRWAKRQAKTRIHTYLVARKSG